MDLDDIRLYLPRYLSEDSQKELFSGLKDFPENIDDRFYSAYNKDAEIVFQGDGLKDMLVVNLPDTKIAPVNAIILSNSCDIDPANPRDVPARACYCPIFNLNKYRQGLIDKGVKTEQEADSHINSVRRQEVTQIFYLPKYEGKLDESLIFLDRLNNIHNGSIDRSKLSENRLFTLSNYGFYVFLLKLSIHFLRIREEVDRKFG